MRFLRLLTKPTPMLAIGLGVFSVTGSLFLAASNRVLTNYEAGYLIYMYFLLTTIGVGVLGGLEQEMTRTISRDLALGVSPLRTLRGQLRQAGVLGAITLTLTLACGPFLVGGSFGGHWYLLAELMLGLVGSGISYLIRGVLSGYQRFRAYSATLMVEGLSRTLPALVLVFAHVHVAWIYGLLYAMASVFASLAGLVGLRGAIAESERTLAPAPADGPVADAMDTVRQGASNMVMLTLATLASQVVLNGVPLGVPPKLYALHEPAQVKSLGSAMGLVRVALLVVFPLQAPLLPKLTRAATQGDMSQLRRHTGLLVGACVAVGLLGTVAAGLIGPWLLVHYLASVALSWQLMASLAFGTTFLMTAYLFQSALIALKCHRKVFIAWTVGVVVLVVILVIPVAPLTAAGLAAVLSPAVVTAVMFVDLIRVTRARSRSAAAGGDPATDLLEVTSQA
jgi:O-antigen/teichoic acid export membrane protein